MKSRLASLTVVSLLVLATGAGAGVRRAPCSPSGAHTIAADAQVRVYSADKKVYGCAFSTGKTFELGNASACMDGPLIDRVHVAGPFAGFGAETCGTDFGTGSVVVRRLTDGKVLVKNRPATDRSAGAESYQRVDSLVLKADGAVAWIGVEASIIGNGHRVIEVHRVQGGVDSVLDSGAAVQPASLRRHGSQISWRHGRTTRTATLS